MVKVDGPQHILLNHPGDGVIGGDDDVVAAAAGFQLGVQDLVGVKGVVYHLDAGQLLKGRVDVQGAVVPVGDVLAPVIHIDAEALALVLLVICQVVSTLRRGVGKGGGA